MSALRNLKAKMKLDRNFHRTILRSAHNEILIDIDGDREADIAFLDTSGNGDIDFLAIDSTGDGEFDLYIGDTDESGTPNIIVYDEDGGKGPDAAGGSKKLEDDLIVAASLVRSAVITGDYVPDTLDEKLDELDRQIKKAQAGSNRKRSVYNS